MNFMFCSENVVDIGHSLPCRNSLNDDDTYPPSGVSTPEHDGMARQFSLG